MGLVKLNELPELQISEGILAHAVNTQTVTVLHVQIKAGSLLPEHVHYNEQVINVIAGELELTIEGKAHRLVPGVVMVLPPNVPHSGRAVTDVKVVDVFHPAREDFRGSSFGGYEEEK